jgi:hypothetical protein
MSAIEDIRQRTWDYGLTVLTVALLGSLGVQSFIGTLYVWWAQRTIPGWEQASYRGYIDVMNGIAAPQLVLLVLAMGLCVPKRLFSRTALIAVSAGMVLAAAGTFAATGSIAAGTTVYLTLSALIQVAVVALTAAGAKGPSYLTEGRLTKLGSGLLHLGFIVFGIVIAALQRSPFMSPVFWTSTVLMVGGTAMSFYASRIAIRRTVPIEHDVDF